MTTKADIESWRAAAQKEAKRDVDMLLWRTPEGIDVKPLYTQADLEGVNDTARVREATKD